jgi:hypothetical protein
MWIAKRAELFDPGKQGVAPLHVLANAHLVFLFQKRATNDGRKYHGAAVAIDGSISNTTLDRLAQDGDGPVEITSFHAAIRSSRIVAWRFPPSAE